MRSLPANAHRLVAELLELKRELTTIFITHLHPDHYLGIEVIKQVWPEARIVAYRQIADAINDARDFKIAYWGKTILQKMAQRLSLPPKAGRFRYLAGRSGDRNSGHHVWRLH